MPVARVVGDDMTDGLNVGTPRVLMVDDEPEVADAYALRLEGVAEVTTTYGAEEALATVDEEAPLDVVLLDRHMPGRSGDDVLSELRDRELQVRVIMVTAIDPGLDVLELPFDDYLCKPVDREDLRTAVDQQCQVLAYELLGEYFSLESTRALIEAELSPETRRDHEEFAELDRRTAALGDRLRRLLPEAERLLERFSGVDRATF
jgi:DNA-binding response OmpR family regulator